MCAPSPMVIPVKQEILAPFVDESARQPEVSVSGDGTLDVGPRWSGGVFLPTTFIVQAGGSFRLMTGSSVIVEPGA
jgi:hypothetical protein